MPLATVRVETRLTVDLGGETIEFRSDETRQLLYNQKFDVQALLTANGGAATMWTSAQAVPPFATFQFGVLAVDPDSEASDQNEIAAQITAAGSSIRLGLSRAVPLILGSPNSGANLSTMTGQITGLAVQNNLPVGTGGNNKKVRLLLLA